MKIHLPAYSPGVHEIVQDLQAAELDLDPLAFSNSIHAALRLDRHDPYFEFKIQLNTLAMAECDRCLEQCAVEIAVDAPMLFVAGSPPKGDDVDDEEIVYVKPGTIELDLTKDLRDLTILAYSGRHLCCPECLGLCAQCGANLNEGRCSCSETSDN